MENYLLAMNSSFIYLPEIGNILKSSMPEIEKIYAAIKKVGFSKDILNADKKHRRVALEQYDDNATFFRYIKRDFLYKKDD